MENRDLKEYYNSEPVYYCSQCLSLKILGIDDCEYCDECGSTDIEQCSIEEWEEKYKNSHNGIKFLDKH